MAHDRGLKQTILELRAQEFADLPEELVVAILDVEAELVESREEAVDRVRRLIFAAADERAAGDDAGARQ